jgi:hypothetical protein
MHKKIIITLSLACALVSIHARAAAIAPAKAAELASHRIEKLVTLNKISATYLTKLNATQVELLPAPKPGEAAFQITASQVKDRDGKAKQLVLLFDASGKALSYKEVAGPDVADAPVWPNLDALSLNENALHYLLDNGMAKPELKPFYLGLVSETLTQIKDASGRPVARVIVTAKDTKSTLELLVAADGKFQSAKVLPPPNIRDLLTDHQGDDWLFLGCVRNYHECEHMGHDSGFEYHAITHDHRYCTSGFARYTCFGRN